MGETAHRQGQPNGQYLPSDPKPNVGDTGALYLVLIQVASRALTFLGNQFLLRYLSPSILGLAIQLELVSVTILYTARESLRVVLQRQPKIPDSGNHRAGGGNLHHRARALSQQAVNLAYLTLLIGLSASYIFGHGYLHQSSSEVLKSPDFKLAFSLYALATLIELLSEPAFVVIQQHSLYKARARAETGAAISRCLSACLTAFIMHTRGMPTSVLPFAVGQLFYAGTLIAAYLAAAYSVATVTEFSLLPRKVSQAQTPSSSIYWLGLFSTPLLRLTITFYAQSVFKLFLTQGDSFVLSVTSDLASQGAFALASNYGGLLSRLLFQPIEESSRTAFGSLLASHSDNQAPSTPNTTNPIARKEPRSSSHDPLEHDIAVNCNSSTDSSLPTQQRLTSTLTILPKSHLSHPLTIPSANQNISAHETTSSSPRATGVSPTPSYSDNATKALAHLTTILRLYTVFSLPLIALLPHVLPPLIATITGPHWCSPSTTRLLSAYACYLPLLAINGVLDAFVTSVATPGQLTNQSVVMLGVALVYGLVAWTLMVSGPSTDLNITSTSWTRDARIGQSDGGLGPAGLVYANMVSMTLRIAYSILFIRGWVSNTGPGFDGRCASTPVHDRWRQIRRASLPHFGSMATAAIVAIALQFLMRPKVGLSGRPKMFLGVRDLDVEDVGYLIAGGLVLVTSILTFELEFLWSAISPILPPRVAATILAYLPVSKQGKEKRI